jgi:hypothetical protein
MKNAQLVKNYQYWNGLNEFYCKGNIMLGPNGFKAFCITWVIINLPAVALFFFTILVNNYKI